MTMNHRLTRTARRSRRVRGRLIAAVATAVLAATMLVPAAQATTSASESAQSNEYVPFVTDFPKAEVRTASEKPYVPFVTDFPKTTVAAGAPAHGSDGRASAPAAKAPGSGIEWDVAARIGVGAALGALLAAAGLVLILRVRPVRS